ncbi:Serine/threonine protein kinase [Phytophthora megakarya]|uniref:Serine/threonine protein kinase n=1 Tax=Phytophthora megakarya TaxID=4795 RepID=A0A225VPP8_9STRA|nr:Serine/threonine protein kinase [Phytophthora megakarya]
MYQAALGLDHIHEKGTVHSHLKLTNILVDDNTNAKLSDFGLDILHSCSGNSSGLTSSGLRWCPPECLKTRPSIASDVYSFAMCIVEAVIGEPPLNVLDDDSVREIIKSGKCLDRPEGIEDSVWQLVGSITSFDPGQRVTMHFTQLVDVIKSDNVDEQEQALGLLFQACTCGQKSKLMYDAGAILVLMELVNHGHSCFIQVEALGCLRWVNRSDSSLAVVRYKRVKIRV